MQTRLVKNALGFLLLLVLAAALAVGLNSIAEEANAQKAGRGAQLITSADLDHAFVQGMTCKYILTDEEMGGRPLFYSNGTIVRRMNARIILDYTTIDNRRNELGQKLYRVRVDRPDFQGGPFEKDAAFDSGGSPGYLRSLQPGDLVN